MNLSLKSILEIVLIAVISVIMAIVLTFIPVINFALFLLPVPFVVASIRGGKLSGIISLAFACGILSLLIHPFLGLGIFLFNFIFVIVMSYTMQKEIKLVEQFALSGFSFLASVFILIQVFSWIVGQSIVDYLINTVGTYIEANSENFSMVLEMYKKFGLVEKTVTADKLDNIVVVMLKDMKLLIPSVLIITSAILGGINYLISRAVIKRLRIKLPDIPRFRDWDVPKGTVRGFFAIMVVAFIGDLFKLQNFDIVFNTIYVLFSFIFIIQGLSTGEFFLSEKKVHSVLRVFILTITVLVLSPLVLFLGLFDHLFKIRIVYKEKMKNT